MNNFKATQNDDGRTLLKFIENVFSGLPKSRIEKAFRNKDIKLNGKRVKDKKIIIKAGDEIEVYGINATIKTYEKVTHNLKILFEDDNILVVDKPVGVVVHGEKNSLDNQVLSYLNHVQEGSFVPSHIGRIDKVTSGIMLYGKTYSAVRELNENVSKFKKVYRAKTTLREEVTFQGNIFHNEALRKEEISYKFGKPTLTIFRPIPNGEVEAEIKTGRKHQIRASLEEIGHPILGDTKYGGAKAVRVFLHSYELVFNGLKGELKYLNEKSIVASPYF